jgi:hypothetical protein
MELQNLTNEQMQALRKTDVGGAFFSLHALKCGNILNYDTAEGEILHTVIDWQDLKWLTEDSIGFNMVHSPIRLNEDVVKKLGFVFFHKHNLGYKGESEDLFLSDWTGEIKVFFGGKPMEIYFVHELQNLYYSLTGMMLYLI